MFSRLPRALRRTALLRLALGYALVFTLSNVVLGLIAYGFVAYHLERQSHELVANEVERIVRARGLNEIQSQVKLAVRELAPALHRGFFYFLADETGACALVSATSPAQCAVATLPGWPPTAFDGDGWAEIDLRLPDGQLVPVVAHQVGLPAAHRLIVARDQSREAALLAGLRAAGLAVAGVTVGIALAMGWLVSRGLLGRVRAINEACAAIGVRGLDRRVAPGPGEDEFVDLARSINGMLDRIGALMRTLGTFTDQVAHDLRTPLTRLRSKLETAAKAPSPELARERIHSAIGDLDGVLGTFQSLLEIARVEAAGVQDFAPLRIDAVAVEVAEIYRPLAEDRGIELRVRTVPVELAGQRVLLQQMLANLVDNALKFTPAGGQVELVVEHDRQRARIVVADTGPGIAASERQRVFERFFRGPRGAAAPGHGLGLSLVRAIADQHGFDVELGDNHPGLRVTIAGREQGAGGQAMAIGTSGACG
jgi:signal transduction histidine kinase